MSTSSYPQYIAIDFGTTNTTAAYWDIAYDKPVAIRFNESGTFKTPSAVFVEDIHNIIFGLAAKNNLRDSYLFDTEQKEKVLSNTILSLKNYIGHSEVLSINSSIEIGVTNLISSFFTKIKQEIEKFHLNHDIVSKIVLTHPANFRQNQKNVLRNAANQCGFEKIELIEEPVAAAYDYDGYGDNIFVFDLGGGTLDLVFMQRSKSGDLIIKSIEGESYCGGDAMDIEIYNHITLILKNKHDIDISKNGKIHHGLLVSCQEFKEKFSRAINAGKFEFNFSFFPPEANSPVTIKISKQKFDELLLSIVDTTVMKTKSFLKKIEKHYEVDTVILTGGASMLPLLQEKLKRILPIPPVKRLEYDIAVVKGACSYAQKDLEESVSNNEVSFNILLENALPLIYEKDDGRAFNEVYQLACRGHLPAMLEIGKCFLNGKVVKQDIHESLEWLNSSADKGYFPSKSVLAGIYLEKKEVKAYNLFKECAENRMPAGYAGLAKCLYYGIGIQKDEKESIKFFNLAAKNSSDLSIQYDYFNIIISKIFEEDVYTLTEKKIKRSYYNDMLMKCKDTYGNYWDNPILIYNHQRSNVPHKEGIVFTAEGIIWNNDERISNPIILKWVDLNQMDIRFDDSKRKLILNTSLPTSLFPQIDNRFGRFERFKKAIIQLVSFVKTTN